MKIVVYIILTDWEKNMVRPVMISNSNDKISPVIEECTEGEATRQLRQHEKSLPFENGQRKVLEGFIWQQEKKNINFR